MPTITPAAYGAKKSILPAINIVRFGRTGTVSSAPAVSLYSAAVVVVVEVGGGDAGAGAGVVPGFGWAVLGDGGEGGVACCCAKAGEASDTVKTPATAAAVADLGREII
jgi:hypothetical protein